MKKDFFQKLKLIQKSAKNFTNQSSGSNIFGNNFNNINPGIKPLMDILNQQSKRNEEALKQAYNKYSKKFTQSIKQVKSPLESIKNPLNEIKNPFENIKNPLNNIENSLKDIKNPLSSIKIPQLKLTQKIPSNLSIQSVKSKLSTLKDNTLNHSQSLKQQFLKGSQKLKQQSNRIYEQKMANINIEKKIKKGFNFIFWRFTIFVAILTFAYAVGTAIPKEIIRSLFNQNISESHQTKVSQNYQNRSNNKQQK